MSFGLGLTIAIMVMIGFALLAGRICHIGDLEKDPLDRSAIKPLGGASLRVVGDSEIPRKH
jgi:hypothetical protein